MGIQYATVIVKTQDLYVGPELRTKNRDNQQCMTSMFQDPMSSGLGGTYSEFPVEFRLRDGERYEWWTSHQPGKEKRTIAMVHGAVNYVRTRILLDTGARMISLDLARKLKLKLNRQNQVKVFELGGVPAQITASAKVKITLGSRVVYIMEFWVANIGEGLDVLLGMNFMFRAGVCVCVREGLVQLPDKESILMYDENVRVPHSVDLPVTSPEKLYLMPGEHAVVRIQYGHTNPEREVVWAGRGDRWVTKIILASGDQSREYVETRCLDRYENTASQDRAVRRPGVSSALERELIVNGRLGSWSTPSQNKTDPGPREENRR
ncbi:hypothetical protein PHMEG_00035825 [Phytophthora megakarya]|uniref:Peptidase A2 domain-containing protein n=1 Tax=Phytophthora megakarya TaxID=4795 RepID=A0A225UN73_9STRA|nr:hypothetical protein PHMEG_00035825 [Phytophthora megakarya]